VVAELKGSELPNEIVILGAHLDSWELGTGALDNGCNAALVIDTLRAIKAAGVRPKRTIRFILFSGEEEGLLGSLAYTKMHQAELANHVAAVILDNGQGPVVAMNLGGRADLIPAAKDFAKTLRAFGEISVDDNVEFGTDTGPFSLAGLPGINLDQDSPDYKYTHHSAVDTYDKVKPDILSRDTAVMALTSFWIADRAERLASPWPAEKTARMLIDKKQDRFLKMFGIWPFGDLGSEPEKKN
jgi:Zn-dependent M28 family amino/carboxypeptidase